MQLSNGERIFKIGPVVFEPIHYKQTYKQSFPLYNISVDLPCEEYVSIEQCMTIDEVKEIEVE